MSWAHLDDEFPFNEKVISLTHMAFRLYVCAIVSAAKRIKSTTTPEELGTISVSTLLQVCKVHNIRPNTVLTELLQKNCLEKTDDGYNIHDFAEFHSPTFSQAEKQKRYREKKKRYVTEGNALPTENGNALPERYPSRARSGSGSGSVIHTRDNYNLPLVNAKPSPEWASRIVFICEDTPEGVEVILDLKDGVHVRWEPEFGRWFEVAPKRKAGRPALEAVDGGEAKGGPV